MFASHESAMETPALLRIPALAITASVLAFLALARTIYNRLRPTPIPGIPYVKRNEKQFLGDVPDFSRWNKNTGEIWTFFRQMASDLHSPIFQAFMRPGGRPWVILADFREAYDIQTSRQGEFDRSAFLADVFGPLLPGNHVWMPSNDEFRAHRSLIRDTMSPAYLHKVVAPAIYDETQGLLRLWQEKLRLASSRPFKADKDIVRNLVDVVLRATYGISVGVVKAQRDLLELEAEIELPATENMPVHFPEAEDSAFYQAIRTLVDSISIGMSSPLPRYHMHFALSFYPSLVSARRYVDKIMTSLLQSSVEKFREKVDDEYLVQSAVDLLIQRELQAARKENRSAKYGTQTIRDELFGFYLAGHETTSTTICWAVKHLTRHPDVQSRLRSALNTAHPMAFEEKRLPTPAEIVNADVPYLDAFIEENHRLGQAIPTVIRRAMKDVVVLGHVIPKGTDVFMLMNGPDFQSPGFPVSEELRSSTSRKLQGKYGHWDENDIDTFKPERFLQEDTDGVVKFDPFSGPVLPYGAGLRGCFGFKLAVLELKVIITMIVWSFILMETPDELSSFGANDHNTHRARHTYVRLANTM